jgi:hypothetical protein
MLLMGGLFGRAENRRRGYQPPDIGAAPLRHKAAHHACGNVSSRVGCRFQDAVTLTVQLVVVCFVQNREKTGGCCSRTASSPPSMSILRKHGGRVHSAIIVRSDAVGATDREKIVEGTHQRLSLM